MEAEAPPRAGLRLVGHKGADKIRPGNTLDSFAAAVETGVDTIELDVLWTPDGKPSLPAAERTPLVIAHDWHDAARREPLTLEQGLEAFTRPPLDTVEIDLDLKLAGREDEVVGALRAHGLLERAMTSTMELSSLAKLRELEPGLRRGWTVPKVTKDWNSKRWAKPLVFAALIAMRRRLPRIAERQLPELAVDAMWVYHPLITPALAAVTREAGIELIAWTVDDTTAMRRLIGYGVNGICSNDPRLFTEL